jgi:hypothetical protein
MIIKPIVKFIEIYFYKLGFLDGFYGLIIAKTSAFNMFLKFCKLSELIIEDELYKENKIKQNNSKS